MSQDLEDLIKKEKKFSLIGCFSNLALTWLGEGMQLATRAGMMDYNWFTGHLSDFAVSAGATSFFIWFTVGQNKYIRAIGTLLPATIATLHEFYPIGKGEDVFDPQDIALYWIAAAVTYSSIKLLSSERAREKTKYFLNKINPLNLFRKEQEYKLPRKYQPNI